MAGVINSLRIAILATVVVTGSTGCGSDKPNPNASQSVSASARGVASLFEAECLNRRSIGWAMRKYESERAACIGAISNASIGDCRANVTDVEWSVRASDAPLDFKVSYFFDEVEHPSSAQASCEILIPKELNGAGEVAARNLASKHRLVGPFRSGERGFSVPTLNEYWTDSRGQPRIGVFYYPANTGSADPVEKEHAAYPWTLMQWQEKMLH